MRDRSSVCGAVLLALGLLLAARPARACGCVDWPAERRMAEADRVFIGRTELHPTEASIAKVRFSVLEMLKGDPASVVEIDRVSDDCERSYQRGELALVFVKQGHAPVCAGNVDLDAVMPTLGEYLAFDSHRSQAPRLDALKLALAGHVRGKQVSLFAPTFAGKSLQVHVGGTRVSFVSTGADELLTAGGITCASLTYVALRTPEQIATYVLIGREHGRLEVLHVLRRDLKIK